MIIRKAKEKDIPRILELLEQVLQIHADIRPDIFIPGTTKYTIDELRELLKHKEKPIYVAVDEDDVCVGYAFCQLQEQPFSNNMVPFKTFFIDDLCVSQEVRGQHVGESLFEYVKNEAKQIGCYEVTLNVWEGNTSAEKYIFRLLQSYDKCRMPLHCRALLSFPAGWIHLKYMQRHILLRQQESAAFVYDHSKKYRNSLISMFSISAYYFSTNIYSICLSFVRIPIFS